ncbi:RnfABCDGE type electron transport complex subunit G [Lentiprolixibacter aurantiacus]|uniref:Ion-translocating oxidoreductase complex subunit G n=1 Tax=Lentiprolixibacter aurantiacus TaxID=2993939 RepID=A0AAE3MIS8_9FLAO|nr:RnfABCDGE type electron transport complex subunit G [Lentiprolixibacter aurantiacus]MCX2718198.1 RnfABCDGE type electron transport complex subunit G [Lentiprolixibacter aurantiacus]
MVKKKESTLINMVIVLFLITLAAGLSLGYVNDITLEPKAKARLAKKMRALNVVLPQFNNNPISEGHLMKMADVKDSVEIYPAAKDGVFVGAAVTGVSERGYSGLVKLMVGFEPDGNIINIAVLEQKETPGLGTKMKGEKFLRQFRGKHPADFDLKVRKDGGEVDALAGATISTRAFSEATQQAYDAYLAFRERNLKSDK